MRWWEVARAQGGAISRAQLLNAGCSAASVTRMAASGELRRVTRGVYLAGSAPPTYQARLWSALLATDGVLGYTTAGRLWGVEDEPDDLVHLIIAPSRHITAPAGVRLHRAVLPRGVLASRSAMPTTSRSWTVLDLLGFLPEARAGRLADRAIQRRWISEQDCARRLRTYPGRRGNQQLRALQRRLGDGAAADSERLLHRLLRKAGVRGWVPNHEVWFEGELIGIVDVALPARRLAIEVDGMAYHVDVDRFRADRAKQNALVALGWTVLRFTWADLTERPGYVTAVIQQVAA